MKRLALVMLMGLGTACGSEVGGGRDSAPEAPNDARAIVEAAPADSREVARDVPVDEPMRPAEVGAEVGAREVDGWPDAPTAPLDAPLDVATPDRPLAVEVASVDGAAAGERPTAIDGATCRDRVLSYDDRVPGAYMSRVNSLAFSPDGARLTAGIEHSYASWDLDGGTDGGVAQPAGVGVDGGTCSGLAVRTCPAAIYALTYLPDGRLAGSFCGGSFIIFGCEYMPSFMGSFAFSPVGSLVADTNNPIRLWDTWTAQQVKTLASGGASTLAFSPDGAILVGGVKGVGVRVWDVASGAEMTNLALPVAPADAVLVRVSPDGRWIGALYPAKVRIWNLRSFAEVATFDVDGLTTDFAFTRDGGSVVTGGSRVNVYAVADGSLRYQAGGRTYVVAVSPDGGMVAASGDMGVPINLYCLY